MACSSYLISESASRLETKPVENDTNQMKNISPFMSKDLIEAAGFNVKAPIVGAIIGNLTGTLPTRRSESEMIKCEICDCELSSGTALNIHNKGLRHKKRLKALEIIEHLKEANNYGIQFKRDCENPNILRCEICSKTVNSAQQLEIHLSGAKHKRKLVRTGMINILSDSLKRNSELSDSTETCAESAVVKKKKYEPKANFCDICNIFVNSQIQYDEHILSKRHITKAKKSHKNITKQL